MTVKIMNKSHFPIVAGNTVFPPFEEIEYIVRSDSKFKEIRCNKSLRVGKHDNTGYKQRNGLIEGKKYNFIYDALSQHAGAAYIYAIEALANPVIENLEKNNTMYSNIPLPGPNGAGLNLRYFNSARINQQGKCPVGPNDIFISHGIGDKNYWTGDKIEDYRIVFCPGQLWKDRMIKTGYKGEIFVTGYTKLDPIFQNKIQRTKRKKPYISWLPTHGYSSKNRGRSSYPFFLNDYKKLPTGSYDIGNGMHPTTKLHSNKKQLPTIRELVDADVVIADAGSTIYEAWALGIPVIFPDWICKKDVMTHFSSDKDNFEYIIYSKQIGYHAKDFNHLLKLIEVALSKGMKDEEKEFINGIFPKHLRGNSGKETAKVIKEISNTL